LNQACRNVLITGALGNIGRKLTLSLETNKNVNLFPTDIRPEIQAYQNGIVLDITSNEVKEVLEKNNIDTIIHLATILPGPNISRELEWKVDVEGGRNLIEAAKKSGVKQFITTTSGAAYGYNEDNPDLITEETKLRGTYKFAYSYHKALFDEELQSVKEYKTLIFRPCTILGRGMKTPVADLFRKKIFTDVKGSKFPFTFVWDDDVVNFIIEGLLKQKTGVYNLASPGTFTMKELSILLERPFIAIPESVLSIGLTVASKLKLTQYNKDQIDFLKYRPALDGSKAQIEFETNYSKNAKQIIETFIQMDQEKAVQLSPA
jgi:UDP-glucose 4-epimerase